MSDNAYQLMTKRDLLRTVRNYYAVDINTGVVFNKQGKEVRPYTNEEGHLFVRLYHEGKRKASAVHRLVWMVATGSTIPKDFEIHHQDKDVTNNAFQNLLCLHRLDHRKFHETEEEIPF